MRSRGRRVGVREGEGKVGTVRKRKKRELKTKTT